MTPERIAALVAWWVRRYTRGLPRPVAERRIEEIAADLHDHIGHERARGAGDRRIALAVLSRAVRGLPADASWRAAHARTVVRRPALRVAAATALLLLPLLVATLLTDAVAWSPFDFAIAAALLGAVGLTLQASARGAGAIPHRIGRAVAVGVGGLGVAAMALGETGDAPGLVLLGILLALAALRLAVRTARGAG